MSSFFNYNSISLVSGTASDDYMSNRGSNVTLEGNSGNDELVSFSDGSYVTMNGGSGNDTIESWSPSTFMIGGDGKNYLYVGADYATVVGGDDNDEIITYGEHALIYGGGGNDAINVTSIGDYATVIGAEGDDVISLNGGGTDYNEIWYFEGDGNDKVIGAIGARDTLYVDVPYTVSDDGNDLLVKAGSGSIRFQGMAGQSINIDGTLAGAASSSSSSSSSSSAESSASYANEGTNSGSTNVNQISQQQQITYVTENHYHYVDNSDHSTHNDNSTNVNVEGNGNNVNLGDNSTTGNTTNTDNSTNNIDNSTNIVISGNTWTYNGGDKVINNYHQGEVVELASDYQGIDLNGNSFFVKSSSGSLEIQNSRDKFIGYSAGSTQVAAYSYVASGSGTVDGRGKSQAEIMIGGDNSNNQMYAGSGGSSLWGGNSGNDTLTGGAGYDEFFYAVGSGNDVITNAGDNDVVNLLGVSLSQITYAEVSYSDINIGFTDGGKLQLQGQAATGFRLEGVTYTANRSTGGWSAK